MRLVCPNCDAQYEVDDGAIADAGRDVQCSNCGHAWFQMPPDIEAELEAEDALFGSAPGTQVPQPLSSRPVAQPRAKADAKSSAWDDEPEDEDLPAPSKAKVDVRQPVAPTQPTGNTPPPLRKPEIPVSAKVADPAAVPSAGKAQLAAPTIGTAAPAADQAPQPVAARRGMDESLLAVLREEAERETAVRKSQTPRGLESQPDLGLEETAGAASAAKAVRDRLARLRGPEPEPETTERPTARRDLLPDIEEINSTLRASTENRNGDEVAIEKPAHDSRSSNSGFRSGFSLMLLIAVLLIATYLAAPKIAEQLPATKNALGSYVAAVDAGRVWLDGAMRSAITGLQNLTGAKP